MGGHAETLALAQACADAQARVCASLLTWQMPATDDTRPVVSDWKQMEKDERITARLVGIPERAHVVAQTLPHKATGGIEYRIRQDPMGPTWASETTRDWRPTLREAQAAADEWITQNETRLNWRLPPVIKQELVYEVPTGVRVVDGFPRVPRDAEEHMACAYDGNALTARYCGVRGPWFGLDEAYCTRLKHDDDWHISGNNQTRMVNAVWRGPVVASLGAPMLPPPPKPAQTPYRAPLRPILGKAITAPTLAITAVVPAEARKADPLDAMLRFCLGHPEAARWLGRDRFASIKHLAKLVHPETGVAGKTVGIVPYNPQIVLLTQLNEAGPASMAQFLSMSEQREYLRLHNDLRLYVAG